MTDERIRELAAQIGMVLHCPAPTTLEAISMAQELCAYRNGARRKCKHENVHHEGSLGEFCDDCGAPV